MNPSPTPSTVIAQTQNQSSSSSGASPVEVASKNHRFWFRLYVVWIVLAAIASAWLTWMLWRSGNRQQDAVIADANQRTQDVRHQTEELKTSNLALEKEVNNQKARAAEAERALLELQQKVNPRKLPEHAKFVAFLKEYKRGPLEIRYSGTDPESRNFALEIEAAFKEAGWNDVHLNNNVIMFPQPVGVELWIKSTNLVPDFAGAVQEAFKLINIPVAGKTNDSQPEGTLILVVGSKPPTE